MTDDPIITMKDLRRLGVWCRAKEFARTHNLDWIDFLKNGIPASKLESTGDGMALKVVEAVRNGR